MTDRYKGWVVRKGKPLPRTALRMFLVDVEDVERALRGAVASPARKDKP